MTIQLGRVHVDRCLGGYRGVGRGLQGRDGRCENSMGNLWRERCLEGLATHKKRHTYVKARSAAQDAFASKVHRERCSEVV